MELCCVIGVGIRAEYGGTMLLVTSFKCWLRCSTCITYLSDSAFRCSVISRVTTSRRDDLLSRCLDAWCLGRLCSLLVYLFLCLAVFLSLCVSFMSIGCMYHEYDRWTGDVDIKRRHRRFTNLDLGLFWHDLCRYKVCAGVRVGQKVPPCAWGECDFHVNWLHVSRIRCPVHAPGSVVFLLE